MDSKKLTYNELVRRLNSNENFSFSRFGDGEWKAIMGVNGMNCDKHIYFKDMGDALHNVLINNPKYDIGLQPLAYRIFKNVIDDYISYYNLTFCDSDILHKASIKGLLESFFDAIKNRNIMLIAPSRLMFLREINLKVGITIPEINCWNSYKDTLRKILEEITDDMVLLYSSSMMSNVLIDDVYNIHQNKVTQIDCGSLFDPYINLSTRSYHKDIIRRLNQ